MAASVVVVLFLSFIDITTSSLLLLRFHLSKKAWITAVNNLQFCSTSLDLWFLSCFRFSLTFGAVIGCKINPRDALRRLKLSRKPIVVVCFCNIVYTIVKFLSKTECSLNSSENIYLWCFFGQTIITSFILCASWWMLGKGKLQLPVLVVNECEASSLVDREPLLDTDSISTNSDDSNDSLPDLTRTKVSLGKLLSFSKPDISYILGAFVFLLSAAVGEMFIPYYTGQVIDFIAIEKNKEKFEKAIAIMVGISFFTAVCSGIRSGIFTLVMGRFYIRINKRLFGSIVHQEIGFFDQTRTGDIVSRLTSDTGKMGEQVSLNINVFLRNVLTAIGVCVFMFQISWKLSIVSLISIPIVAIISDVYGTYFQKLSEKVQSSIAKANEVAEEVISSMKTVRSFGNENGVEKEYSDKLQDTYDLKVKEAIAYGGYSWCNQMLELVMDAVTLYYGGHLVIRGELSGGQLVSFILYLLSLGEAIQQIGDVYTGLVDAVGAAEKVFEYIERKPKITNDGNETPDVFQGSIDFKNVSFSYPSRPEAPVLRDVSFSVNHGETIAIVGPSGGGKSTCINLLEHFYEPSQGEVMIDGVSVKDFNHQYLHHKIALVSQEPVLFARSLKENIAYNICPDYLEERIKKAAVLANAHDFISELTKGYDTLAGEKGQQISGGQKQRIAIARALIRDPRVILFDEATSALDSESENKIQEAIYQNLKGRTVLIVAHRLSTIEKADRIIVINKGELVEIGTHRELMANQKTYAKLVKHQLLSEERRRTKSLKEKSCESSSSRSSSFSD